MSGEQSHYRVFSLGRFRNASVSKVWAIGTLLGSCAIFPLRRYHWRFLYSFSAFSEQTQLWKLLTCKFLFLDVQSIVSGCFLIYFMRILERRFGSRKYASFLLWSVCGSISFELCIHWLCSLRQVSLGLLTPGPSCVLFSCLTQFALSVPYIPFTQFLSIPISVKLFPYLLGVELSLARDVGGVVSCSAGVLSGLLYSLNLFNHKRIVIPRCVCVAAEWCLGWLGWVGEDRVGRVLPMGATVAAQRLELMDRYEQRLIYEQIRIQRTGPVQGLPFLQRLFNVNPAMTGGVSEEKVARLLDMGFSDRARVVEVLRSCEDDLHQATNVLLHQSAFP